MSIDVKVDCSHEKFYNTRRFGDKLRAPGVTATPGAGRVLQHRRLRDEHGAEKQRAKRFEAPQFGAPGQCEGREGHFGFLLVIRVEGALADAICAAAMVWPLTGRIKGFRPLKPQSRARLAPPMGWAMGESVWSL